MHVLSPSVFSHKTHRLFLLGSAVLSKRPLDTGLHLLTGTIGHPPNFSLTRLFSTLPPLSNWTSPDLVPLWTPLWASQTAADTHPTTLTWRLSQSMASAAVQFQIGCIPTVSKCWQTRWTIRYQRYFVAPASFLWPLPYPCLSSLLLLW